MKLRYNFRSEEGFSLIEVMVSIVLLSLVLLPIISYFITSIQAVDHTEQRTIALNLAQAKIEELKIKDFNNIVDEIEGYGAIGSSSSAQEKFKRKTKVVTVEDGNMKRVTVQVLWNQGQKKLKLTTLIGNY